MLTDNNQISRNCFVIIYCHLTKVSSQIKKCIIFEPDELSITLSTPWFNSRSLYFLFVKINLIINIEIPYIFYQYHIAIYCKNKYSHSI